MMLPGCFGFIFLITNQRCSRYSRNSRLWLNCKVVGTDISPIQPSYVPLNCKFELHDAEEEWSFRDNTFDLIHLSRMLGCIHDWTKLYKEAYRCLKPGGWIEHTDLSIRLTADDSSLPPDSPYRIWEQFFVDAGIKTGKEFNIVDNNQQETWLKEAGFPVESIQVVCAGRVRVEWASEG